MPTREEILAWWDDPVADDFIDKLGQYFMDFNDEMRKAIDAGEWHQASGWNARMAFAEEIMSQFKDEMLDEGEENAP